MSAPRFPGMVGRDEGLVEPFSRRGVCFVAGGQSVSIRLNAKCGLIVICLLLLSNNTC